MPVTLNVPASGTVGSQDMAGILRQLVAQANNEHADGHYRLQQIGNVFHVIPTHSRGLDGNWMRQASIFDASISISTQERSAWEMVDAICNAVGVNVHIPLRLLQGPPWMVDGSRTVIGATDESARSVLTRTLAAMSRRLTWRAYYDARVNSYFLLLFIVPERAVPGEKR
jgi:hypothetical protein